MSSKYKKEVKEQVKEEVKSEEKKEVKEEEKKEEEKQKRPPRGRYWECIIYIDSFARIWDVDATVEAVRNKIVSECIKRGMPCILSPLHDKDHKEDKKGNQLEELKKPHFHLIVDCTKYYREASVIWLCKDLAANNKVERINSLLSSYRYLNHLDNPEKAQYSEAPVVVNFDLKFLQGNKDDNLLTVLNLIYDGKITSYSSLINFLLRTGRLELLKEAMKRSYFYTKLIESYTFDLKQHVNYLDDGDYYNMTSTEKFQNEKICEELGHGIGYNPLKNDLV